MADSAWFEDLMLQHRHGFIDAVANSPRDPIVNPLFHSPSGKSDDRCAASHGLDHRQPKRFLPLDGEEQRGRSTEQLILQSEVRLAQIFDVAAIQMRPDL